MQIEVKMMSDLLHPSIKSFKLFINNHPKLLKEIRANGYSWQTYYEKWALLGEDDLFWEAYKAEAETNTNIKKEKEKEVTKKLGKHTEIIGQLLKYTEHIDLNQVQKQMQSLSKTIATIQEVLGNKTPEKHPVETQKNKDVFQMFKD